MLAEKYTSDYVSSESIYRQCCCVESVYYRTMLGSCPSQAQGCWYQVYHVHWLLKIILYFIYFDGVVCKIRLDNNQSRTYTEQVSDLNLNLIYDYFSKSGMKLVFHITYSIPIAHKQTTYALLTYSKVPGMSYLRFITDVDYHAQPFALLALKKL